jgi:hypothetical protein
MVYGKCQELITHFKPTSPEGGVGGKLGIGELMLAGAGAGAVTSFVLYVLLLLILLLLPLPVRSFISSKKKEDLDAFITLA